MTFRTLKAALAAAAITFAGVGAAQALPTSGSIWINVPTSGANASIVPGTAPDATFSTGAINYTSSSGYDPGDFLNHPLFSNESSAFVTACGASGTGCSLNNSFVQITGTIGLNSGSNSFVVGHDDGAVMSIDTFGTVVSAPGPTSFSSTPFTVNNPGPAGNFNFTLNYGECCGAPAALLLQVNDVTIGGGGPVPEPATWALMMFGVGAVGAAMRSSRKMSLLPA